MNTSLVSDEVESRAPGWDRRRILLAEDDVEMRRLLADRLADEGYDVIESENGLALIESIVEMRREVHAGRFFDVDLIVSDIRMPLVTGIEALRELRALDRQTPMILITAFGDEATRALAGREGASLVIDKPFDVDDFLAAIHKILDD